MDCMHEDVIDKVKVDDPTTYVDSMAYARGRTKKLLKKRQASQGISNATVSKPIETVAVKTHPMLESLPVVQEEPRVLWLQRDGVISMPKMSIKEVQDMEEPFKSMDEEGNSQACSSIVQKICLDCTREHRVRFADEVYKIPNLEIEEEVESGSSCSTDMNASWETLFLLKVYMAWSDFLVFFGVVNAETWLQDYKLCLLKVGISEYEGVQQVFLLLVQAKSKRWFDTLHDEEKTDCDALKKAFQYKYVLDAQHPEVKQKVDDCLHKDVRDKVEVEDPTTYADVVAYARGRTKKLLKKRQASQRMANAIVSKPVEAVVVKTQPILESLAVVQEEPSVLWLQRDGAISMPKMQVKEVHVMEEPFKSMDEVENSHACSSVVQQMCLDCTREHRVRFADKVYEILDLETEEELVQSLSRKDEVVLVVEEEQVCFIAHEEDSQIVASSKLLKEMSEVKQKPDGMKQRLDGDFKAFEWEFDALCQKLLEVLKKRQASQRMWNAIVSKPIEAVAVKTQPMLESLQIVKEEPRVLWLQRDGAISMPKMPIKEVQVMEKPFKSMDKVESSQACSSMVQQMCLDCTRERRVRFANEVYDTPDLETEEEEESGSSSSTNMDSSRETESYYSRYRTIDILYVDKAMQEDKLEKVQDDVLDPDLMKQTMPTNEYMQVYMAWSDFLVFSGVGDVETWLQDYRFFLLKIGQSEEESVQQVFPLLVRGKAKRWFNGLHDKVKTDQDALQKAFRHKYVLDAQLPEVTQKLDGLKQRLDGDFKAFEWYKTIDILYVDKAMKEDKLEKVQDDVLDVDLMKETMPTNEDMQVKVVCGTVFMTMLVKMEEEQVCFMAHEEDSQILASSKPSKEVCALWLKGKLVNAVAQWVIRQVRSSIEEISTSHGWVRGLDVFVDHVGVYSSTFFAAQQRSRDVQRSAKVL
ncbi:hypothetical protein L7F22_011102 [Adiantum nelumboides]|nr:hypothetical protein [Adiantum nelumboides]